MPKPPNLPASNHFPSVDRTLLSQEYAYLWDQVTASGPKIHEAMRAAHVASQNMTRYQIVSSETGVPWFFIAAIHYREASQSWNECLHNGDPWNKVTVHVPAGRGPWNSWEEAAVDAMQYEGYAGLSSWGIGDVFRRLELYNGSGYRIGGEKNFICHKHGNRPGTFDGVYHGSMQDTTPRNASPYVFNGTPFYEKGISIEDHSFYPDAVDDNVGVMLFLKALEAVLGEPLFADRQRSELFAIANEGALHVGSEDDATLETLIGLGEQANIPRHIIAEMYQRQAKDQPGRLQRFWACCNFGLRSDEPRFHVLDRIGNTVTSHLCAHGVRSEDDEHDGMAVRFSNVPNSNESSLGICRCAETYEGKHGLSLRIDGLDASNSNVRERDIVIHSAAYVSAAFAAANGRVGCSNGCFALSLSDAPSVILALQGGSLLTAFD